MSPEQKTLNSQIQYMNEIIKGLDAETAMDTLDGYDLIMVTHVIDTKYGAGTVYAMLGY